MRFRNRELQATHQLLTTLERSKERSDGVLDSLPCLFAVINAEGRVVKGNDALASIVGSERELLVRENLARLFRPTTWDAFLSQLGALQIAGQHRVEFEIPIDNPYLEVRRQYHWRVSRFQVNSSYNSERKRDYFAVVGNDISELRRKENELAGLLATMPLGLVQVDFAGYVTGRHATRLEWLLGDDAVLGRPFDEVLFAGSRVAASSRAALQKLRACLGGPASGFAALAPALPYEASFHGDEEHHIGIHYQPVVVDERLEGLLLILEDRTASIKARRLRERQERFEEANYTRVLEIKNASGEVLSLVMGELGAAADRLGALKPDADDEQARSLLERLRQSAELGGFSRLARQVESRLKGGGEKGPSFTEILAEWREYASVHSAARSSAELAGAHANDAVSLIGSLFQRYNRLVSEGSSTESALVAERITLALDTFNYSPLTDLGARLTPRAQERAAQLGKQIHLDFDWEGVRVDEQTKIALEDILWPLIENAITHGIEPPAERAARLRPETGAITVHLRSEFGALEGSVDDDGRGLDTEKILKLAVQNQVMKFSAAMSVSPDEMLNMVFRPELWGPHDTKPRSLMRLNDLLRARGGRIRAESPRGLGGARVAFRLDMLRKPRIRKACIAVEEFNVLLSTALADLARTIGARINFKASGRRSGILAADAQRMILSITTCMAPFAYASEVDCEVVVPAGGLIECRFINKGAVPIEHGTQLPPEFSLTQSLCEDYILQHNGTLYRDQNHTRLLFGHVLESELLPTLRVSFDSSIMPFERTAVLESFRDAVLPLGLPTSTEGESSATRELAVHFSRNALSTEAGLCLAPSTPAKKIQKQVLALVEEFLGYHKT